MPTQYQPGIPTGTVNLDQDYINIRNNFTQLNTTYGSDHIAFDEVQNNGYHKTVHIQPRSPDNDPNTVAGIGQLYSRIVNDGYDTDTVLYFKTGPGSGLGDKLQLTSNFDPRIASRGYTFLPGGLVLQWGRTTVSGNGDSGTVNFTTGSGINFANACYQITTGLIQTSDPNNPSTVSFSSISSTSFSWFYRGSGNISSFTWMAIGS